MYEIKNAVEAMDNTMFPRPSHVLDTHDCVQFEPGGQEEIPPIKPYTMSQPTEAHEIHNRVELQKEQQD